MSVENPDPIERELFELEDTYVQDKLDALSTLADACAYTRRYVAENEAQLTTTLRSPQGEVFKIDMLPYLPEMILEVAKVYYKHLREIGKGPHARQTLKRVERKWKGK